MRSKYQKLEKIFKKIVAIITATLGNSISFLLLHFS